LGQQFDQIVAREARGFLPVVKRLPVAIAEGSGSRVRDVEGNELIDLTAGWGVCAIGHCHPRLVAAISEQAGRLMQTTNLFYTLPQLDLIEKLRATRSYRCLLPNSIRNLRLVESRCQILCLVRVHRAWLKLFQCR
jgi:acetylornithine/succinyldiaminopimelate/putrescine aminotransferase